MEPEDRAQEAHRGLSVSVAVRVRPVSEEERAAGGTLAWSWHGRTIADTSRGPADAYEFEHICPPEDSTTQLYRTFVKKCVDSACAGVNSCVVC
jgi:hypothetical protein